jgi:predicted amidohydrolase YtcJ
MKSAKPFLCSLISAAALLSMSTAHAQDLLLVNARVFTGDAAHPYAQAVAIHGDKIAAVGNPDEIAASVAPNAQVIDLGGKTLLPGLIDSHAHVILGGTSLLSANVDPQATKVEQVVEVALKALKSGKSMRGDVLVVDGLPLKIWSLQAQLNARLNHGPFAKVPVFLRGSDGHTGWGNQALRERAGITPDFLRGLSEQQRKYFGHSKDLVPDGFAVDEGLARLEGKVPEPDAAALLEAGRAGVAYMHELGITSWLDALAGPPVLATYKALADRNELKSHVAAFVEVKADAAEPLAQVQALRQEYANVPGLTVPGIKIFMDGVVEYPSHSAAMSVPYKVTGKMGDLLFPADKFAQVVTLADKAGLIVHVHAIGDRAVHESLNGFEAMRKANGNSGLPDTITHLQFVQPSDIPRFKALGVVASVQLLWAEAGPDTIDLVKPYVDPAIYPWQYPARSMLNAGAIVAGASDWSVSTANVFEGIAQAETRQGPMGVLNASQDMPREAMLYAYTIHAARAMNQQDRIGSIEPGKQADLTLVDRDVLTVSAKELRATRVLGTMVGGEWVYRAAKD